MGLREAINEYSDIRQFVNSLKERPRILWKHRRIEPGLLDGVVCVSVKWREGRGGDTDGGGISEEFPEEV